MISPKFLAHYEYSGDMLVVHELDDNDNCLSGRYLEITLKLKGIFKVKKEYFVTINLKG